MTVFVSIGDPAAELASIFDANRGQGHSPSESVTKLLTPTCIDALLGGNGVHAKRVLMTAFSTISSMNVQDIARLSDSITTCATKSTTEAAELRLWAMVALFNAVQVDTIKGRVLTTLLQYGLDVSLAPYLHRSLSCVEKWLKDWSLGDVAKACLLKLVASVNDACDDADTAQTCRLQILSMTGGDKVLAELQSDAARHAVAHVLKYGKVTELDNLLATITARMVASSPLVDLLRLMCHGSIADLDAFCGQHGAVLDEFSLVPDHLRTYMRALSVCSLASGQIMISLDQVQEALVLSSVDDAEQAVIDAISFNLIDAQIDENEGHVHILSCMYRLLNESVWEDLQQRLRTWRDCVGAVLPWSQHVSN